MFGRLPWLLALEALILAVLVYPLRLKDEWLSPMVGAWRAEASGSILSRFALDQLEPFIAFYLSPQMLKGVLAAICVAYAAAFLTIGALVRPWARRRVSAIGLEGGRGADASVGVGLGLMGESRDRPAGHFAPWLALIAWLLISSTWSPTPGVSRDAALWTVAFGLSTYLLLRRGLDSSERHQLALLMMVLGFIAALISIVQASSLKGGSIGGQGVGTSGGAIFDFMMRFENPRNRFGSVLGHNTAVASFVLMSSFPALAWVLGSKRVAVRLACATHLAVCALAIVLTQSRAAWVIAPALWLGFFLFHQRSIGWAGTARRLGIAVALLAAVLATQAVRSPSNILRIEGVDFAERLEAFSPAQLKKDTRARILASSVSLLKERPLMGHGLYSFPYVYPKAQADYFEAHPDSALGLTTKRTRMAHNEYLQAWIEAGAIGLVLLILVLAEIFRRGATLRESLTPRERPLHLAFGFATAGVAIHALVDFPFHVPALVVPWFMGVVAFASERPPKNLFSDAVPANPTSETNAWPRYRPRLALIAGVTLIALTPLAAVPFARGAAADSHYRTGSALIELLNRPGLVSSDEERAKILDPAGRHLRSALGLVPHHDLARYQLAQMLYEQAVTLPRSGPGAREPGADAAFRSLRRALLTGALAEIERSQLSLRNHLSLYLAALIHAQLSRVASPAAAAEHRAAYVENLETSVRYAPSFAPALHALAELLARGARQDPERVTELRRRIYVHDPFFFRRQYQLNVARSLENHDYERTVAGAEALLLVDGNDLRHLRLALEGHLGLSAPAHRGRFLDLARRIESLDARSSPDRLLQTLPARARLYRAIRERQWGDARNAFWNRPYGDPANLARLRAIEIALDSLAPDREAPVWIASPEGISLEQWNDAVGEALPTVWVRLFARDDLAGVAFRERAEGGAASTAEYWAQYALWAGRRGERTIEQDAWQELARLAPGHPLLRYRPSAGGND